MFGFLLTGKKNSLFNELLWKKYLKPVKVKET